MRKPDTDAEYGNGRSVKQLDGENGIIEKGEAVDEEIPLDEALTYLVMGCVTIRYTPRTRELELEWEGNMMNDGVADAVMAVLLTVESSPASVKRKMISFRSYTLREAPEPVANPDIKLYRI